MSDLIDNVTPTQAGNDFIDRMTSRFLAWKLPKDFGPDAGISFKAEFNEHTDHPMRHEPSGTNLFSYGQAREMVRAMLAEDVNQAAEIARLREALQEAVDVFDGMADDEINEELLPSLRAALEQKP